MNWILLTIAGFFEVGFATCLGKAKETTGVISTLWMIGFFIVLFHQYGIVVQGFINFANWYGLCSLDRNWSSWNCSRWYFLFREPATFWRLFFLFTLIHQLLGLNLSRHIKRKPILIVSIQTKDG